MKIEIEKINNGWIIDWNSPFFGGNGTQNKTYCKNMKEVKEKIIERLNNEIERE